MKILFHSVILYLYSIYADTMKIIFEKKLAKFFCDREKVSSYSLTQSSNKNYRIQSNIRRMQQKIEYELFLSKIRQ